jgi:hypothetical protein
MTETTQPTVTPNTAPVVNTTPAPQQQQNTSSHQDPIEMARKLGELEKIAQDFETYKGKVDPVLETLWSDQELLATATERHNKRLGIVTDPAPQKTSDDNYQPTSDPDTRNALVNSISNDFEKKVGIESLPTEKKSQVRGMVGQMLKEMLDPKGNKTISQVFDEVSLTKLPWYLERAYDLATKDEQIANAKESAKNEILAQYSEQTGVIGAMGGGSISPDSVTLTPQEKKVAARQGISEDEYLSYKKKILTE